MGVGGSYPTGASDLPGIDHDHPSPGHSPPSNFRLTHIFTEIHKYKCRGFSPGNSSCFSDGWGWVVNIYAFCLLPIFINALYVAVYNAVNEVLLSCIYCCQHPQARRHWEVTLVEVRKVKHIHAPDCHSSRLKGTLEASHKGKHNAKGTSLVYFQKEIFKNYHDF